MATQYDYLVYELARGRPARVAFAQTMSAAAKALAASGAQLLGHFAPQLGFDSTDAVVLIRWTGARGELPKDVAEPAGIVRMDRDRLSATVRPVDGAMLRSGSGIYVHRWFTIDGDRTADFVDLSNRAWKGFEGSYDTEIFGLFSAEPNENDKEAGAARLLLLTWYRDHGIWEASREQAHDPASLFAQRHLLTRKTIGRSSLLLTA
jgi:hypothetical protein